MLSPAAIADLNARTDLRGLAEQLGARLDRRGRGTCPLCGGGKTAQRFELKDQESRWVCAVCDDGGDAIKLVMKVRGVDFPAAVEWLGGARQIDPKEAARREREIAEKRVRRGAEAARYREAERRRLYETWSRAARGDGPALYDYFALRGVGVFVDLPLRIAPDMPYFDGEVEDERGRKTPRIIHRGPAMLAPMVDADWTFRGLHITWLDLTSDKGKARILDPDSGDKLPSKKMRGSKRGTFIPLSRRGGDSSRLRAAEGIETTLTLRDALRDGASYRAGGDLGNLAGPAVESVAHSTLKAKDGKRCLRVPGPQPDLDSPAMPVPDEAQEILWGADGDSDPETTRYAMDRAVARHIRPGRVQRVLWAPAGKDWNDLARESAA